MYAIMFAALVVCQSPVTDKQIDAYLLAAAKMPDNTLRSLRSQLREIESTIPKTPKAKAALKKQKKLVEDQIKNHTESQVIPSPEMQFPVKPGDCGYIKRNPGSVQNKLGANTYVVIISGLRGRQIAGTYFDSTPDLLIVVQSPKPLVRGEEFSFDGFWECKTIVETNKGNYGVVSKMDEKPILDWIAANKAEAMRRMAEFKK